MKHHTCPSCWTPLRPGQECRHPICVAVLKHAADFTRTPIQWGRIALDGHDIGYLAHLTLRHVQGTLGGPQDGATRVLS